MAAVATLLFAPTMDSTADLAAHAAMSVPAFPYGQGDAAERILDAIEGWFARGRLGVADRNIR